MLRLETLNSPDSIIMYFLEFSQGKKDLSSWVKIVSIALQHLRLATSLWVTFLFSHPLIKPSQVVAHMKVTTVLVSPLSAVTNSDPTTKSEQSHQLWSPPRDVRNITAQTRRTNTVTVTSIHWPSKIFWFWLWYAFGTCNRICFLRNLVRREVFDLHLCLRNLYTRTLLSVSLLLQSLELNYFLDKTIGWRWNAWGSTWGIIVYRMIPLPWRPFPILSLKEQSNPLSLILGFPSTHYRHNRQTTKSKERPAANIVIDTKL